ncbi:hypothetical protein GQ457_14G016760 [Hibiscus cannabinus]
MSFKYKKIEIIWSCITYWRIEILMLGQICPENSRYIKTRNVYQGLKKYWKILSCSQLSEGAKESLLENKASLEVSESVRLIIAAFDEIVSTRC